MAICPRISQLINMKQQAVQALHRLCCTYNIVVSFCFCWEKQLQKKSGRNRSYIIANYIYLFVGFFVLGGFFVLFYLPFPAKYLSQCCESPQLAFKAVTFLVNGPEPTCQAGKDTANKRRMHSTHQTCGRDTEMSLSNTAHGSTALRLRSEKR